MSKRKRRRDQSIYFMVTAEEREMIEQRMTGIGISNLGNYMRKMALDGYIIHLDLSDVREMVTLLRRCSNNLNQYARRANEMRSIYAADIEDIQTQVDRLWDVANKVLAGLAKVP